ncbi:hypothetical protein LCGC14_2800540, partial [marine sediment metagenome]
GGGYDLFPFKAAARWGGKPTDYGNQFVVQLFGCNLDCPYCYVTREGVWGEFVRVPTYDLYRAYLSTPYPVFHLMGGAPALTMKYWHELLDLLGDHIFHSDLMLTEFAYDPKVLGHIARDNCLYAINIKGVTPEEYQRNTRKPFPEQRFWANWKLIQEIEVPAYLTFTGCREDRDEFWSKAKAQGINVDYWCKHSYNISIIDYNALGDVDNIPWGGLKEYKG